MQQQQANPHLTMKILWAALAATQLMLVFVATIQQPPAQPLDDTMRFALMAVAGGTLFLAFVLPQMFGKQLRAGFEKQGRAVDGIPLPEIAQKAIVPFIIRCALLDSVTVMGFLLSFMSGDMTYVMAFAAIALVGFALTFPSERNVRGLLG